MAKRKTQKKQVKPTEGEQTNQQIGSSGIASFAGLGIFTGLGEPPPGYYSTYRRIRSNPTIALARYVATAPIRTATWSVKSEDGVPDDNVEFIEQELKRLWPDLIHNILMSLDYGWMPFEKVWQLNAEGRLTYKKLKPLLVDMTKVQIEQDTGSFAGLEQEGIKLGTEKCFVMTYDGEAGDLYGRSRHENVRPDAWHPWVEISKRRGQYAAKTAGIIPIVTYPVGQSRDKSGAVKDNFELAVALLLELSSGKGIAAPNDLSTWAGDLLRTGVDISQLRAWNIDFLESKGNHGREFTDTLRHLESLMMRGWLVPERAATEGQYGTKAESESQGELALLIADLFFADILRSTNSYIVNPLLNYNFGESDMYTIWLERGGIDPLLKKFFRDIISKVLSAPPNIDLFMNWLDIDSMLDNVGLPKAKEQVTKEEPTKAPLQEEQASRSQGAIERIVRDAYRKYGENLRNM